MSRALNVTVEQPAVRAMCTKHGAAITAIESLPSGGTRVVLQTGDSAAIVARAFGNKVITADVKRAPLRVQRAPAPIEVTSWAERSTSRDR